MGVVGDFAALAALRSQFTAAGVTKLRARMNRAAAGEALSLVQRGFREGVDPEGKPWAPLKSRKGKILRDTGRLANSFTSQPTEHGFRVGTSVSYAVYHQEGTQGRKKSETRSMVRAYAADAIQAGKLGTKRGRFISRKQAKKLKYVAVHSMTATWSEGSGKIPQRAMVPVSSPNLSERWQKAIDKACDTALRNHFAEVGSK
jgi:phage gpG-like protein